MKKKYICEECGSTMHRQVTKQTFYFNGREYEVDNIHRLVCPKCNNRVFPAGELKRIDRSIRKAAAVSKPRSIFAPLPPVKPPKSPTQDCLHAFCGSEGERYEKFRDEHYTSCGNAGNYVITLNGTGIGETIQILCPVCGVEEDITDTTAW